MIEPQHHFTFNRADGHGPLTEWWETAALKQVPVIGSRYCIWIMGIHEQTHEMHQLWRCLESLNEENKTTFDFI